MKTAIIALFTFVIIAILSSCESTVTTTTTRTDGKSTTIVTERKVDGNVVSNLTQLFVGGVLSAFSNSRE